MQKIYTLLFLLTSLQVSLAQRAFFFITSPEENAGNFEMGLPSEGFAFRYATGDDFSGEIAWARTEEGDSLLCSRATNAISGKFALVRRGDCFFSDKIRNAELSGAVGALICNNVPNQGTINMSAGSFENQDNIPSGFLSFETCAIIDQLFKEGKKVEINIRVVDVFVDAVYGANTYFTPESQIQPVVGGYNLVNASNRQFDDVRVTLDVTSPSGQIQSFERIFTLRPNVDTTIRFPDYIPTEAGEYKMTYTDFSNDFIEETRFVISDKTFGTDNDKYIGGLAPDEDLFIAGQLKYQTASAVFTSGEVIPSFISFGIENAAEVFTGEADGDLISVILYNGDADNDGVLDLTTSFENLTPVAFGAYTMNGQEKPGELIFVELESITGEDVVTLEANSLYYVSLLYDGTIAGTGIAPAFTATSKVDYIFPTTPLQLDQLYGGGWGAGTVITRLHLDGFVNTAEIKGLLAATKIKLSPNPTTDFLNLQFNFQNVAKEIKVGIVDMQGNVLKTALFKNVTTDNVELAVKDLPDGTYILSIVTPEGYRAEKFIIIR